MAVGFSRIIILWIVLACDSVSPCDPYFCTNRVHGSSHVDPYDPEHYYVCDWGNARYMTCGPGTVFDGTVCNFPTGPVTTAIPPTGTAIGVMDGVNCVPPSTTSVSTTTTEMSTSSPTLTTVTEPPVLSNINVEYGLYRKHSGKRSACQVFKTISIRSIIGCGIKCLQFTECTDFNHHTPSQGTGSVQCSLLTCNGGYLLADSELYDFYERI